MKERWSLVVTSTAQLGLGLQGLRVALRERVPSDIRLIRISSDRLERWQWLTGTGLSAPGIMLVLQTAFTLAVAFRPSRSAARGLGVLGAIMSIGYPVEVGFTRAVSSPDRVRTPLILGSFVLALALTVLGFRGTRWML